MKNILTERCIVQKETYICVVWLKSGQKNKKKAFFALSLVRSLENFKQGGWRQCSAHSVSACTRQAFAMPIHNFTAWEYCLLIHPCKVFPDTRIRWIENKSHAYFVLNLKIYITHRRQRELYSRTYGYTTSVLWDPSQRIPLVIQDQEVLPLTIHVNNCSKPSRLLC